MFQDGLEEFDSAREIVNSVREEYIACEKADYINYGENQLAMSAASNESAGMS